MDDRILGNKQHFSSKLRRRAAGSLMGRRGLVRPTPYPLPPRPPVTPAPVIIGGHPAAGIKLYVSNLDYGVSNEDINLLFSDVGVLKRYGIHYDKSGRSKGTAEVVYERQVDAITAIKRYNNVNLDGQPIRIELVGVNLVAPVAMPVPDHASLMKLKPYPVAMPAPDHASLVKLKPYPVAMPVPDHARLVKLKPYVNYRRIGATHARAVERIDASQNLGNGRACSHGNFRGQGRGRHLNSKQKPTAEDLDAELERYHMEAMHIS